MAVPRSVLLGLAAALAPLAVPAAASAADVRALQPCALSGTRSLGVATSGWAPGAALTVRLNGADAARVTADAAGNYATGTSRLRAPALSAPRVRTFRLTVTDGTTVAGPVAVKVVRRGVVVPARARPSSVVRYRAYGFPPHKRLYLHIRRGGKTRGSFRMGRPKGACGVLERRLRYMPLRRWSTGTYDYWFSNTRRFRASRTLYGYRIDIYRRLR